MIYFATKTKVKSTLKTMFSRINSNSKLLIFLSLLDYIVKWYLQVIFLYLAQTIVDVGVGNIEALAQPINKNAEKVRPNPLI